MRMANQLERLAKLETAYFMLYQIEKRVTSTIQAAENVVELGQDDIKYIVFSHVKRLIGVGVVPAQRSNEIDELIVANNLHR